MLSSLPELIAVQWQRGASAMVLARVEDRPLAPLSRGAPLTQADISALSLSVIDISDPANPQIVEGYDGNALTISDVVFDSLQPWDRDAIGYNFAAVVPGAAFPASGARYQVEVKWQHIDGRIGYTRWVGGTEAIYGP